MNQSSSVVAVGRVAVALLFSCTAWTAHANNGVHLTYHWHLHQPIYWPEYAPGKNRYQFGAESVDLKLSNTGNYYPGSSYEHPRNQLVNGDGGEYDVVFDKADRVAAYQDGGKNSIATLLGHADAGVSVSYSGALQENIWSFGKDSRYGYYSGWNSGYTTARNWKTWSGASRADMVGMTYHHAFSPLLPKSVLRKEIQIFKEIWWKSWGGNPNKSDHSKGFWPVEAAFSRHMIGVLKEEGYDWVIVPNSHLARTCQNYMDVAQRGNSGWNIDPPNKADVLGPYVPANQWWQGTQDGRGGTFPAPYAYQAHRAKYVNPDTGAESLITIVPMCDLLSYQNGFASMGTGDIDAHIAPFNDPNHPSIVLMAHDGDNAWGGGSSYYFESVPGLMNEAASKGYHPISINQFVQWHTPTDVVHIEDGAWVNAANDWGHPQFINWLWPPTRAPNNGYNAQNPLTFYDLETPGWTEDWRNWAVLVAGANYCETAEQITISQGGSVQAWKIQEPTQPGGASNNPNAAEQAWHFYLGGLDSGFMYYGTSLDDEMKQSLACNRAISLISGLVNGNLNLDQTPPTVFKPQRFPWNPGGKGWGPLTHYIPVGMDGKAPWPSDFHVWTHVFDVSGVTNVTLYVRVDADGTNPIGSNQNETFAGGGEVGAWQAIPMTQRTVPKGNVTGNSQLDFFIQPDHIADYYWAKITGFRDKLLDYYVMAVDSRGNVHKSDIQHVWVADDGSGPTTPPATPANLSAAAVSTNRIDVSWAVSGGATGYKLKRGTTEIATLAGTSYSDVGLVAGSNYCYSVSATNSAGASAFSSETCATTPLIVPPQAPGNVTATALATNRIDLAWSASAQTTGYEIRRGGTLIATTNGTSYIDVGLAADTPYCYTVAATNAAGSSAQSAAACATTFPPPVTIPAVPASLTAAATSPTRIELAWPAVSGATGYVVQRASGLVNVTGTSFTDLGLSPGSNYCYAVASTNSAGASAFTTNVCATTPSYAPIFIGAGPAIGTDKHGVTWYQEFQDWRKEDLRALDPNDDEHRFNDANDPGRDLVAFYSREEGDAYYFRVDFFDLLINAENGQLDVYVAIDCAAGGQGFLPDGLDTNTDHPWEVCIKLYDVVNYAVVTPTTDVTAGNWLGSYWRADLDSVEFGIKRQVLLSAGWDGTSPVHFQVLTAKDSTELNDRSDAVDALGTFNPNAGGGIGLVTGGCTSSSAANRAKYAVIAHANQSLASRSGTQAHIYRDLGTLKPGFVRTVDSHEMLGVPLNMHLSGTLLSSFLWARAADPNVDGPAFLDRLRNFLQTGRGSLIGGVYAEHIMPYFEGEVNRASIAAFNDLAETIFGLTTNDMKVMHTPERVLHSNTNWVHKGSVLQGKPFADILAGGYVATYLDEVTHLHWWFYPDETNSFVNACPTGAPKWAGAGGCEDRDYHHKLHKINGVLTFLINDREDQAKFGNDDGGMMKDTRYTLLTRALTNDHAQITVVFDDWEAFAGNSFGQGANNNADQYHNTIRWAANHQWIEVVKLQDVVGWAQGDPAWVIDHGYVYDKSLQTYEWLKKASEHSYDNWYYGLNSGTNAWEENFFNRQPPTAPSGWKFPETKIYGDVNTPGTLFHDAWATVAAMPASRLQTLAEWSYSAMIYETAWHDENPPDGWAGGNWFEAYQSRNYQINFDNPATGSANDSYPAYDPTSGWALRLHGHARKVGVLADAAAWAAAVAGGSQGPATTVTQGDVDDDVWDEYILKNDKVYLCLERWGARVIYAFVYDPATQEAVPVIGAPAANPAEEHDGEGADNGRCSAFKDRWAGLGPNNTRYVDYDFAVFTAPVAGSNYWQFVSEDGAITKRIVLPRGRDVVWGEYTLGDTVGTLYLRHGLGPNQLDLLKHGDAHLETGGDGTYAYGLRNTQGGAVYAVTGRNNVRTPGNLPQAGYQNREMPLVEQVELYNTATNFTTGLAFSLASALDADGDGLLNTQEPGLGSDYLDADSDDDGMTDGFEMTWFNTAKGADPAADPDGDGQTNAAEAGAGTNPLSAGSVLRIVSIQPVTGNGYEIVWGSVAGKDYRLMACDTMTVAFTSVMGTNVVRATGPSCVYTNTPPGGTLQRFYRVDVVEEP